jgi:hypothetical protein
MTFFTDNQAALSFAVKQSSYIERQVIEKKYPQIKYPRMVPVDTSASPFAGSVTFFTQDIVGQAKFINGKGDDIPLVNITKDKFEQTVNDGALAYQFSLFEIGQAMELGRSLQADGAMAIRTIYEQFVEETTFLGNTAVGAEGLYNMTGITTASAGATFAASTADEILAIVNTAITAVETETKGIEMVDTIVLPLKIAGGLERRIPDTSITILDFLRNNNRYTRQTNLPLMIEFDFRLDSLNKMVVYRRDPSVLKLHMPMPLRFLPPQLNNVSVKVPAMFRFAPLEIRAPKAVRYISGVSS